MVLKISTSAKQPLGQAGPGNLGRSLGILWVTLLLVLALGFAVFADRVVQHTVKSGESVTSIARKYGVSNSQILSENNIANADLLRVGQVLSITLPDADPAPTATPAPVSTATAQANPGNPIATPTAEQDGQAQPTKAATAVPAPTSTPQPASGGCNYGSQANDLRYTVRLGDSLYGLAARYNVTVSAIKTRNCMNSDVVQVGQLLIIPNVNQNENSGATSVPRPTSANEPTDTPTPSRPAATATPAPTPTPPPVPPPPPDTRSWLDRLLNR
ncbi:MAG: LysM peptidoglycan-binding domain-containing protein [Caldilineaceae bacterium]|nr:LysM peptidoglycan-binding domain-containing protein [Caldilineaceae bacterium]